MAIRKLQRRPASLDLAPEQRRRVNAVSYRLDGSLIKTALILNPGKIVIAPRGSGKSTALAEYVYDNFPEGAVFFVRDQLMGEFLIKKFPKKYLNEVIIVWGGAEPADLYSFNLPVFSDEIFLLPGFTQKRIIGDVRFAGAVGTPSGLADQEVMNRCILCCF